jgi:acyl-CoA reductase-like NAD-dependent aldehyde dehydrogenase
MDAKTQVGPLSSEQALEFIRSSFKIWEAAGAKVATGGKSIWARSLYATYFVNKSKRGEPTFMKNCLDQ